MCIEKKKTCQKLLYADDRIAIYATGCEKEQYSDRECECATTFAKLDSYCREFAENYFCKTCVWERNCKY